MLVARDVMTADPFAIRDSATVGEAAEALQTLEVRHLPVVNRDRELVGMLSDRDLRALTVPNIVGNEYAGRVQTARGASVSSLMSGDVLSVEEDAGLPEIVDLMLENKVGAIAVTDPDGTLTGIVSYVDILKNLDSIQGGGK
jgi:CBS domain-containing protein